MSNVEHLNDDAAVGYLRLSVVRREDPFSPPNQRRLIEQRAEQDGKRIVAWYDDLDKTARKPQVKRPGYQAATEDVLSQRAKTLYVAKLDRLERRGMGHLGTLLDKVEEAEGQIIFVADGLDTTQPGARQMVGSRWPTVSAWSGSVRTLLRRGTFSARMMTRRLVAVPATVYRPTTRSACAGLDEGPCTSATTGADPRSQRSA